MIEAELLQKYGNRRVDGQAGYALPEYVARVLNECVMDMYQEGMARAFNPGNAVLKVRIELQASPLTIRNQGARKGRAGFFRSNYDLVERCFLPTPARLVVYVHPKSGERFNADTLAHEFGHLQDYMRDPDLYARRSWQKPRTLEAFAVSYARRILLRVDHANG